MPSNTPWRVSCGSRARMGAPSPPARASQAARMVSNPSLIQASYQWAKRAARTVSASSDDGAAMPSCARDVAGNSVPSGEAGQIDADADGQPARTRLSSSMPASFLPSASTSLGHLTVIAGVGREMRPPCPPLPARRRKTVEPMRGRRIGTQQQGGGEIAGAGVPDPAAAAAARGLAVGDDPHRTRLAGRSQAPRLAVGGIQFVVPDSCVALRPSDQGSSALAAASAAVITGEAAKMNSSATAPDRTMMARSR